MTTKIILSQRREIDVWTPGRDVPTTLSTGDTLDGGDVLPGFTYALADLFN